MKTAEKIGMVFGLIIVGCMAVCALMFTAGYIVYVIHGGK